MWSICYASNSALRYFEQLNDNALLPLPHKKLMTSILSSRLLSGGLPYTYFEQLFTPQFNAHFNILVIVEVMRRDKKRI